MYQPPRRSTLPLAIRRAMPPGVEYLGEDANNYYFACPGNDPQLGGFFDGLGNMFKRMVKFTPKSFTPGNLYKGFVNTTMAVGTGGMIYALPKNVRKTLYDVSKVAIPVVAAGVGAYYAGPAVMSTLGPKLAQAGAFLGKNIGAIGGKLFEFLGKLSPSQQQAVADKITGRQIAQMEQTQELPPELIPMFQQAMQGSLPQAGGGGYGYTPPLTPPTEEDEAKLAKASMGGETSPAMWAVLIGLPVAFYALQSKGR